MGDIWRGGGGGGHIVQAVSDIDGSIHPRCSSAFRMLMTWDSPLCFSPTLLSLVVSLYFSVLFPTRNRSNAVCLFFSFFFVASKQDTCN